MSTLQTALRRLMSAVVGLALSVGLVAVDRDPAEAGVPRLLVTTSSLPQATVAKPYAQTLTRSGGRRPYTWKVSSGRLPAGLQLSRRGRIAGVPTTQGTRTFTVRVTDSRRRWATKRLTIAVGPMSVTAADLPVGREGSAYSAGLTINGGKGKASWRLSQGTLPPGLRLSSTGLVSGTPSAPGNYPIVVTASTLTSPTYTASAAFTITIVERDHVGPVVIEHCGTLAFEERWTSARVHRLTCPVVVPAGVTLTVQPGTIVKADAGAGITVRGTLSAPNTGTSPATFTSWQDDTAGGDTNGDGTATQPEPGGWHGITGASAWQQPPASVAVQRIAMRYAGMSVDNLQSYNGVSGYQPPTMSVTDSTFQHGSSLDIRNAGAVTVTGNTVTNTTAADVASVINGIRVIQHRSADATTVSGNTVDGATSCGIYVGTRNWAPADSSYATAASPVVRDNAVRSQREPVCVASGNLRAENLTGNTSTNTSYRAIRLAGRTRTTLTAPIGDLPVTLGSDDASPEYTSTLTAQGLTIDAGGTLTVAPGSVVRAHDGVGLRVHGSLVATGTSGSPVTFTDVHDDAPGDYAGDGAASSSQPFDWAGIHVAGVDPRPLTADRIVLRYAPLVVESLSTSEPSNPAPAISVTNSTLTKGARLDVMHAGPITVTGNTVTNTTSAELFRTASGIRVQQRGLTSSTTVSDNTVDGATRCGIAVGVLAATAPSPVVTNNAARSDNEPVCVTSHNLQAENLTGNTSTNTAYKGLLLSGRLVTDMALPFGDLPITIGPGGSGWGNSGLTVAPGTTLTANPGTIVKAYEGSNTQGGLTVNGALEIQGTEASPVTFTGVRDDGVGGDYEGNGSAAPLSGQWAAIRVANGPSGSPPPSLSVSHLHARYGSLLASVPHLDEAQAPALSVAQSTFEHGSRLAIDTNGPIAVTGNTVSNTVDERGRVPHSIQVNQRGHDSPTTVSGNDVAGASGCGIFVMTTGAVTRSPVVTDNASSSGREPICVYSNQLRGENLTGNSSSNTSYRGLALGGRLVSDLTAPVSGLPLTLGNVGTGYSDNDWSAIGLTVAPGATLTVDAGAVVKSHQPADWGWVGPAKLTVDGILNANGTAESPVTFTSIFDDAHGGDYAGDGSARAPTAGDWGGIVVGSSGQTNLTNTEVLYGP